jgi:hypothetical protein
MRRATILLATILAVGLAAQAALAVAFSPTANFTLSPRKTRANAQLRVKVAQNRGEEELARVRLSSPAGFKLATDRQLQNGEKLGDGEITIDAGPRCSGQAPISGPVVVPVNIVERNVTSRERSRGVKAVYVVDLRPVTTIDLLVKGSPRRGWVLEGNIPANGNTCPPFTFDATIFKRAAQSNAKIITNPRQAGRYRLSATFFGAQGGRRTVSETVRITR